MTPSARRTSAALAAAGLAACAASFLAGRASAPSSMERVETPTVHPIPEDRDSRRASRPRDGQEPQPPAASLDPARAIVPSGDSTRDRESPPRPGPRLDLEPALAVVRKAAESPGDEGSAAAALAAAQDLETRLLADPDALRATLERFDATIDSAELGFLASVLGRVDDPEVEAAALRIGHGDPDPRRRAAALDVLDALDSTEAMPVALEVLAGEREPNVRLAALRAIPDPAGASWDDAAPVLGPLAAVLAGDRDPEARRRSAILIGQWHRNDADLRVVLESLRRDPDPGVRAGCAYACEIAGRRSPEVVSVLARVLEATEEDPLVRDNAAHALERLSPLPPDAHEALRRYREHRSAEGEAD